MQDRSDSNINIFNDDSGIDIDRIGSAIIRRLWVILLVGLLLASLFYFYAKSTYVEKYTSTATLSFTTTTYITEEDENGNAIRIITQKKNYSATDVERYQFLITSDVMVQKIYETLEKRYSENEIESSLLVNSTAIPGIFTVSVTNNDKNFCSNAIYVVIETFPGYLKGFDTSLGIDVIKHPKAPVVSNTDGAVKKALYGFIAGSALIVVIIFISEILSDTVRQIDDIRESVNAGFLGSVPMVEGKKLSAKKKQNSAFLLTDESRVNFSFIESFKAIRTKVENIASEKGYKLFIVTSTFESEGKTTLAINLACALAQKGKSVLLVDCDIRKPSVMRMAGIKDDDKIGLIQIIKGKAAYADAVKYVKPLGIFVLPSGGISSKSTEVLDADKVREVLNKASGEFDFIIIDTPPAHVVSDCLVLAPLADALIFTIKRDYAKISDINDTLSDIATTDIDIIGSVLTMNNEEGSGRYLSRRGRLYYYRYRRGYRKGYYSSNNPYGYEAENIKNNS